MNIIDGQIIYQCEYCKKRFLTKQGAKKHEEEYCYLSPIPKQKRIEKIMNCNHEWDTIWDFIPGELVKEPDHEECIHCGVWDIKWYQMNKEEPTCGKE